MSLNYNDFNETSLQVIGEFCQYNYDFIGKYIAKFPDYINFYFNADYENLSTSAIEIWNTIAVEEIER
jgi:hypothetical protein